MEIQKLLNKAKNNLIFLQNLRASTKLITENGKLSKCSYYRFSFLQIGFI